MGEAKRKKDRAKYALRERNPLWRPLLLRSLYFHVLPLLALLITAFIARNHLAIPTFLIGISMCVYAHLTVRDGAFIYNFSVCERKSEPMLYWITVCLFTILGVAMLALGVLGVNDLAKAN